MTNAIMELERRRPPADEHERLADPQPETNIEIELAALGGSRVAALAALGRDERWADDLGRLVSVPVAFFVVIHSVTTYVPWARPSDVGIALGALFAIAAARVAGRLAPRALATARRVPIVVLTVACGGLGACVGGIAGAAILVTSPWLGHAVQWIAAGASFGMAYAGLLFVPLLLKHLGKISSATLVSAQAISLLFAAAYATWNAASIG